MRGYSGFNPFSYTFKRINAMFAPNIKYINSISLLFTPISIIDRVIKGNMEYIAVITNINNKSSLMLCLNGDRCLNKNEKQKCNLILILQILSFSS